MFDLPELTPAAYRASVAAVDQLYALLRKLALDGWQGMRVQKALTQEAEEEAAVRNLIALLRQLHAFRSEAISQVEALLDGKVDKASTYSGKYALVREGDEINIFDQSIFICLTVYDGLRKEAGVLSVILGKSYSELVAVMLGPVFESPAIRNVLRSLKTKPGALREIISSERDRLSLMEKITDHLTEYHSTLKERNRQAGRATHKS
jgi:hypothetical protein